MSLIQNGYAVSTRRGFLGALFSAVLAFALFDLGAATAQPVKQIKLTEKHIQGVMAAYNDMAKVYEGAMRTNRTRNWRRGPRLLPRSTALRVSLNMTTWR
jgi:hypothetical protein